MRPDDDRQMADEDERDPSDSLAWTRFPLTQPKAKHLHEIAPLFVDFVVSCHEPWTDDSIAHVGRHLGGNVVCLVCPRTIGEALRFQPEADGRMAVRAAASEKGVAVEFPGFSVVLTPVEAKGERRTLVSVRRQELTAPEFMTIELTSARGKAECSVGDGYAAEITDDDLELDSLQTVSWQVEAFEPR